jgi:hypothetical protein
MGIIDRVKNICISPKTEWPVIAEEPAATGSLIAGYVAPLAAIGVISGFVGSSIIGHSIPFVGGTIRTPMVMGIGLAVFQFVMAIVGVFIIAFIINALATSFGGEKNSAQALKVAVYSYTPGWIAGIFHLIPGLGILVILGLYGLYLLYLGLPRLMKCPEDKSIGYTIVVVVCAIVLYFVIGALGMVAGGLGLMGSGAMSGGLSGMMHERRSTPEVTFDKDSPLGKLQDFGKKMEEAGKKAEAAQKSGDTNAQMQASMDVLGTMLGGGKKVEPVEIAELKAFVPDTFAGLPKKSGKAEKTGFAGLMVSKAEASYGDDSGKRVTLDVSDSGGVSGMLGLASWAGVQGEREDEYGSEKTSNVNGRLVHEKISKSGSGNEFGVVLGDRFVVSARGNVDLSTLKSAVSGLDLGKLEAMKDVGVKK